jgi:hypothetical protein
MPVYNCVDDYTGESPHAERPEWHAGRRMYVVCRRDLPPGLATPQCIHAVAAFNVAWALNPNPEETIVVVQVPDEANLRRIARKLTDDICAYGIFFEPDIDEYTALATYDPIREIRELPLLQ